MKTYRLFLLLALFALTAAAARGQGTTARPRTAASLPPTCTPASATSAAERVAVDNVFYLCVATNVWSSVNGLEGNNTWSGSQQFCGSDPWVDVTCFGARAPTGSMPTMKATCTSGSNQLTSVSGDSFGSPQGFMLNDGVTLYGCGKTNTLATPSGLTVTPSGTWGLAQTESPVAVAPGGSTYRYTVIARDVEGALTAPENPVTIANGLASLGLQSAAIRTLTRSNDQITVVLAAAPASPLVAGDLIDLIPTNSQQFGGWYNVAHVDSSTQFTVVSTPIDTRAQGWMLGDTTSYSGGGHVAYYRNNYLKWTPVKGAWMYYVCAQRPGDAGFHLIGMTKPTGPANGYLDAAFEDYGSPYMDKQSYPPYVQTGAETAHNNNAANPTGTDTNAVCTASSPTNDPLSTWITGYNPADGNLTLHDAASQNVTATSGVWDDAPGIRRALAAASYAAPNYLGQAIYIPPSLYEYPINSHIRVPDQVTIWQSGKLVLNETISTAIGVNWYGDWSSHGNPQFGINSGASVVVLGATPGIYVNGTASHFRNLNIWSNNANGTVDLVDDSGASSYDLVNFTTGGGSTDYLGMAVVVRGYASIQMHFFNLVSFLGGPDQVTDKSWTPLFWVAPSQNYENVGEEIMMDNTSWNRRGIGWGGGGINGGPGAGTNTLAQFRTSYSYRQGGITPMFACMACPQYAQLTLNDVTQDTEGQPLEAAFIANPSIGLRGPRITAHNPNGGAQTPLFSGLRPSLADIDEATFTSAKSFQNRDFLYKTSGDLPFVMAPYATSGNYAVTPSSLYTVGVPLHGAGGYSWWFDLAPPTNVTATAVPFTRGIPAGTYQYAVSSTGADGGETIMAPASSPVTATSTASKINVAWTSAVGSYSSNVWRCDTGVCLNPDGTINTGTIWYRVALHVSGSTYPDTIATPTRYIPPQVTGTGSTLMNGAGLYSPFFEAPPLAVSQLPAAAAPNSGQLRRVTDSTAISTEGQTCAGGGSAAALAFSNGTVWKCF